jgi:Transmembrane family 220, helix
MMLALRVVHGALTLLFLFAAAVNFNDPDPVQWVAIYTAGAVATAWTAWRPATLPWWAPLIVAAIAAAWAATLAPRVLGKVRFGELWAEFEMKNTLIEEAREYYGLCITAGAMVLCTLTIWLATRGAARP